MSELEDQLTALRSRLASELRAQWQRDLPFDELISDRWRRAEELGFGEGASIYATSYVYGDVRVGAGTWIGPFTLLDGSGGIEIGSTCSISTGVQIYTHDTVRWALSGGVAAPERESVGIGNRCYIGPNAVVAAGVQIGDECVVGACSFVNRDLPDRTIAVGIPCRSIGRVEIDGGRIELRYD